MNPRLLTTGESAELMNVAPGTIRSWASRGLLAAKGHNRRGWPLYAFTDLALAEAATRLNGRRTDEAGLRTEWSPWMIDDFLARADGLMSEVRQHPKALVRAFLASVGVNGVDGQPVRNLGRWARSLDDHQLRRAIFDYELRAIAEIEARAFRARRHRPLPPDHQAKAA